MVLVWIMDPWVWMFIGCQCVGCFTHRRDFMTLIWGERSRCSVRGGNQPACICVHAARVGAPAALGKDSNPTVAVGINRIGAAVWSLCSLSLILTWEVFTSFFSWPREDACHKNVNIVRFKFWNKGQGCHFSGDDSLFLSFFYWSQDMKIHETKPFLIKTKLSSV